MQEEVRRQVVPLVWYEGNTRHVIGQVTVVGDKFEADIYPDLPPRVREAVTAEAITKLSVSQVFDKDTPLFPANAYEVNEPLAEKRLIDAILNIPNIGQSKGETDE